MVYNKKGAQGIGTLIIFIAMILVAAVAAGVLIQTASSLQSKSLDVGRQSQEKLTTSMEVVQVTAEDTSDATINATQDQFSIMIRLGSGSTPIKLEDLTIAIDTKDGSQTQIWSNSALSDTTFNTTYLASGSNHKDLYIVTGDLVKFNIRSLYNISEGEQATITILSKNGAPQPIDITTPSSMIRKVSRLYP